MTLVQLGDQLDRGNQERAILDLLEKLQREARAAGGAVHVLNGNHEIMNAQGDLRYVTEGGFRDFAQVPALNLEQAVLQQAPEFARPRLAAFLPGGPYAHKLAQRKIVLQLGNKLFAHGGILPQHVDYGLERINREYAAWLRGESVLPTALNGSDSPIWTRAYSQPGQAADCARLVGHSVQSEINAACDGQIWRIDTGMSQHYGGPVQVLVFVGDEARVLKAKATSASSPGNT